MSQDLLHPNKFGQEDFDVVVTKLYPMDEWCVRACVVYEQETRGHKETGFVMWSVGSSHLSFSPPLGGWDGKPQPSTKGWWTCSPGNNRSHTPLFSVG